MAVYILLGCLIIVGILAWSIYNRLVNAKNVVNEAYSGIDVHLQKRFELIPNLIEAVKGYNSYEAETLSKIVASRSASGNTVDEMAANDSSITSALRGFRIHMEDYPDLKSNTQFLKLMDSLSLVEDELAMARRYYNGATRDLNTKMEVFPAILFAGIFGFKKAPFYEIDEHQKIAPEVDLKS